MGFFKGPIVAVRNVRRGAVPQTGAHPRCLIAEVRTPTTGGEFVDLEITEAAASLKWSKGYGILLTMDRPKERSLLKPS